MNLQPYAEPSEVPLYICEYVILPSGTVGVVESIDREGNCVVYVCSELAVSIHRSQLKRLHERQCTT